MAVSSTPVADFVRAAGRTRPGRLPLVLVARPTPAGARVWLWLRPGAGPDDLDGKADKVAVSCWASEARMVRASARFAALIRVDLTRRDALTGKVASPLAALVANLHNAVSDRSPMLDAARSRLFRGMVRPVDGCPQQTIASTLRVPEICRRSVGNQNHRRLHCDR
jgi:hypothetical protein